MDQPTLDKCPGHNLYIGGYVGVNDVARESLATTSAHTGCISPAAQSYAADFHLDLSAYGVRKR